MTSSLSLATRRYSIQPRDRIFVKAMGFVFRWKCGYKYWSKNISQHLSGKYNQKLLDHSKESATDPLKNSWKWVIQKAVEAAGDLIGN